MQEIITFLIMFTVIYLLYFIFVIRKNKVYNNEKTILEIQYLIKVHKLDMKYQDYNKILWSISFANSFIISTTVIIMGFIKFNILWQLIMAFIILIPFIILTYYIIGKYYKKQEIKQKKRGIK